MEKDIHKLAGENFNLGSPKQLGDILFGKFSLPGGKRTQTGAWSTHSDILEELSAQGHELPARILEWRQLAKLKSTYTDALPAYVNPQTRRVHTSYALASTTTGRLSSTEPNLQNIPIRTEEGRRIRQAFIAPKGRCLASRRLQPDRASPARAYRRGAGADQAFADGVDIHAMTASEMFGVPVKGMPPEVRRRAKAINFGIIYGISAFGLANQLGIPRGEADAYIKKYFERFPGIRDYMESTKAFVREHGYVETVFGRRIHVRRRQIAIGGAARLRRTPGDQRADPGFGRRRDPPRHGAAARRARRKARRGATCFLQVHDELVIEAPTKEAEAVCEVARGVMERAALPASNSGCRWSWTPAPAPTGTKRTIRLSRRVKISIKFSTANALETKAAEPWLSRRLCPSAQFCRRAYRMFDRSISRAGKIFDFRKIFDPPVHLKKIFEMNEPKSIRLRREQAQRASVAMPAFSKSRQRRHGDVAAHAGLRSS